ncbi:VOC family protein [Acetobacterium carbinolicum]|jgi:PhnB protein|uniref:VOC family protein n=1 Tax=Acetobacterium TaxID=33951 RepID=UPI000DBEB4C8|nr:MULTISPECIES: VOC family protein [unclassified Acetobacterium]AWW25597.1 VOC family protein [Acetobacterium sp. KB-1]MDK2941857.1 PhnB protein [Acetobacterium sp.]MDZ5724543.1 VOC family protein [Acetobacterium sp. K1/6]
MQIQPYISFNGNCQEAVEFYADVFGTDNPEIIVFGEMLNKQEAADLDQSEKVVIRADLETDETRVLLSDIPPKPQDVQGDKMTLVIFSDDLDEIKILYYKLKVGGTVEMELQETFWSKVYGSLVDKFGVGWQLNYDDGRMSQVV